MIAIYKHKTSAYITLYSSPLHNIRVTGINVITLGSMMHVHIIQYKVDYERMKTTYYCVHNFVDPQCDG